MEYRNNEVKITNPIGYEFTKPGKYRIKKSVVTEGENPNGELAIGLELPVQTNGTINFKASSQASKNVANWWNSQIPINRNTFRTNYNELIFATIGDLTLYVKGGIFGEIETELNFTDVAFTQGNDIYGFGGKACYCTDVDGYLSNVLTLYNDPKDNILIRTKSTMDNNTLTLKYEKKIGLSNVGWMKELISKREGILLKDITLPGSHDAGMSEVHHHLGSSINSVILTQEANIYEQLIYGSRYFDIRVDYDYEELVTYHRFQIASTPENISLFNGALNIPFIGTSLDLGGNGQSITDVMTQAVRFLSQYPEETFIIKFSHVRDAGSHKKEDTINKLHTYLDNNYSQYFFTTNKNILLHEVKYSDLAGKILVVCDYENEKHPTYSPQKGYFRYDEVTHNLVGEVVETSMFNPFSWFGEDEIKYPEPVVEECNVFKAFDSYANESDYETMEKDQLFKWEKNNVQIINGEYKNFILSWTLTQTVFSIEDGAREANSYLKTILDEQINVAGWLAPFCVYIDFIDEALCKTIIDYNVKPTNIIRHAPIM